MHFIDGTVARVPVHTPTPSGGFVAEGGAIPVGALIIAALALKPKKAGSITAITKELAAGSPLNVERSRRTDVRVSVSIRETRRLQSRLGARRQTEVAVNT
jgi:hypothetical protein